MAQAMTATTSKPHVRGLALAQITACPCAAAQELVDVRAAAISQQGMAQWQVQVGCCCGAPVHYPWLLDHGSECGAGRGKVAQLERCQVRKDVHPPAVLQVR